MPIAHSVGTFSGGVRVPMFAGHHVVGSLKVLAFGQRQFATDSAGDTTSKGVTVGFVIGGSVFFTFMRSSLRRTRGSSILER